MIARILLADAYPVILEGLKSLLGADLLRWEICGEVQDGLDAVATAVKLAPDLVILDDRLPRLNGLEAALEIRRRLPAVETLLFIGARFPGMLIRYFDSKVRGCLLKTEPREELIPALETIARHHRFRSRGITEICEQFEEVRKRIGQLTPTEIKIIRLIAKGFPTKQIADERGVSFNTIDTHRTNISEKLNVHSVAALTEFAILHGIVESDRGD